MTDDDKKKEAMQALEKAVEPLTAAAIFPQLMAYLVNELYENLSREMKTEQERQIVVDAINRAVFDTAIFADAMLGDVIPKDMKH